MKKNYMKPSMKVYELKRRPQLLQSSGDYPGGLGYVPGFASEDDNHLA